MNNTQTKSRATIGRLVYRKVLRGPLRALSVALQSTAGKESSGVSTGE